MISSKIIAAARLPSSLTLANTPSAMTAAHNLCSPSLIRAAEVLLPPRSFSSSTTLPEEKDAAARTKPAKSNVYDPHDTFSIRHRPFDKLFDHLWQTTTSGLPFDRYHPQRKAMQVRQLLQDMNDLTKSRMDRWMLSPSDEFPNDLLSGSLSPSVDVWKNAKYDEETKMWSLPFKVPNIFQEGDISANIIKDKTTDSYLLRILGRREVTNTSISEDKEDFGGLDDGAIPPTVDSKSDDGEENVPKSNVSTSDYQYEMQFQLPPLPTHSADMTPQQAQDFYSPIAAHFNADEGMLTVKIPESIVSPKEDEGESEVKDEFLFSVPIESAA